MQPTFYEFFAGGGMARAGLGEHWKCLFANDFDAKKAAAYEANWGGDELSPHDIWALAPFELPGHADLAWASFPCQDLSLAGLGAGLNGDRSSAVRGFWRLMRHLRSERRAPGIVVLENVCGLLTSRNGEDFKELAQVFAATGYRFGALVVDAVAFVPQSRPRLFVIGLADHLGLGKVPLAPGPDPAWHPKTLQVAAAGLHESVAHKWLWFSPPRPGARNASLRDLLEDDASVPWRSADDTSRLLGMMSPLNRRKVEAAVASGGRAVGAVYKRTRVEDGLKVQRAEVRFDGLSGCLRTPSGGSSRQLLLVVDHGKVRSRLLSAREAARLMGLDDDYILPERYNDTYHLAGDGVAVPVVRFLAETIIEPMLGGKRSVALAA